MPIPFRHVLLLLLWSALAGIGGALATLLFREAITLGLGVINGHTGWGLVDTARNLGLWQRVALPTIGGLLAGLVLQFLLSDAQRRARVDYMEAVTVGSGNVSARGSLVRSLSSLFSIVSGGSLGREGSMVQLAALGGSWLGQITRMPTGERRLLVACGAASGMACAYNAPLAGALFVAEIVLGSIAMPSLGPLLIAAVVGSQLFHHLWNSAPIFEIPPLGFVSSWELPGYVVLGLLCGMLAPAFLKTLNLAKAGFAHLQLPLPITLAIGGLLVGVLSLWRPEVWGNGYSVVSAMLHGAWAWQMVLLLLACKVLSTSASIGSGAVGGVFTPTLFVGAATGLLFGTLVHTLFPHSTAGPTVYAVLGMGAFLAAATQAPLMAIVMIFEMTRDYEVVAPLMVACALAWFVSRLWLNADPLYHSGRETNPPSA
ncbi:MULTISPECIES: ClcB-like voltage-gated chloride channel protein [Silvimonas]|uniref:ClcB-like voltage-gated chloride channel protein n=1 Tax=Silvimonas TaxID=300264 RepID=UPI0024B34AD9|nr:MULTISPECIES: ClcB-like voltage-gated chloride channel protein [Silvimonas]MDR3428505.1 ClcB-like voltage-gated chloride channel protein [Silvimonas sp.]